jgi:hypothetical protein
MRFLDSLYGSDGASWSEMDALRLFRYRLGSLLREVYWGPLWSPERSSLNQAVDHHLYRLEFADGFSGLLAKCFPEIHSELGWDRNPPPGTMTRDEALRVIVIGYGGLMNRMKDLRVATASTQWRPRNGVEWLRDKKGHPEFWAVENMMAQIQPRLGKWFSGFLIHGSVASAEAVPGFSDLDTMVVLSNEVLHSETELDRALRFLASTHSCLLQFNPYMHHSHMLAVEMEFEAMSLATTPSSLFRKGVYWGDWPAQTGTAQSDLDCLLAFRTFDWFFEDWVGERRTFHDAYEAIWWASNTIIIPVLYAQLRDGMDRWKPDALDAAKPDLSPVQAELIEFLTGFRERFDGVPIPDRDWWEQFPADTHPGLAAERARKATSAIDWTAYGVTRNRLAQSAAFFRDIRQLGLRCWNKQNIPKPPVHSIWLGLPSPIVLSDEPQPAGIQQYDSVRAEFLSKARCVEGVLAVFEFGQVGCPGLSDLDFLVVVDQQHRKAADLASGLLSGYSAEIMGHEPIILGTEALSLLPTVFPIFSFERILGEVKCPQPTKLEQANLLPLLLSMLLTKYPVDLLALWSAPALRLRTLAAFIHSFRHLKRMLFCIDGSVLNSVEEVVALDARIRSEWTASHRLDWKKTVDGLEMMFQASADLLAFADHLLKRIAGNALCADETIGIGKWQPIQGFPIQFISGWSGSMMLSSIEATQRSGLSHPIVFPASIGAYLAWVAAGEGPASEALRNQTNFRAAALNESLFSQFSSYRESLNRFIDAEKRDGRQVSKYIGLTAFEGEQKKLGVPDMAPEKTPRYTGYGSKRLEDLTVICKALSAYHKKHGIYPKSSGGWDGFYSAWGKSGSDWISGLVPAYLSELPRDPRHTDLPEQQYLYMSNGEDYKLISHNPEDLEIVKQAHPEMTDPMRAAWAYGFWTEGGIGW